MWVSFQGYKMAQGWWINAMFLEDVFVVLSCVTTLRYPQIYHLWRVCGLIHGSYKRDQPLCLVFQGFPGINHIKTPNFECFGVRFLLYFPRVYNSTSHTSNIFLGRCYTHGCVAITISIGLLGTPSVNLLFLFFPRWSSRGLKSTSSLHACLQWPRRQW